ncbi:MAG: hypothetical protein K2K81_01730 [Muribaculaceae bacterium]|nr:hypothetical protein [Muribaculaceae bacterium]
MKEILKVLFEINEYNLYNGNENIPVFKHAIHDDFWIVSDYRENLLETQSEVLSYVTELNEFNSNKSVEKNISMIILMKVEALTDTLKQIIIDLEDDPFCFKKYVISYTDKDLQDALPLFDPKNIMRTLMDRYTFSLLKCEEEDSNQRVGAYHLLYSLAHKLPFLMMNVTPQKADGLVNHFIPKSESQKQIYEWAINVNPKKIENELINKYLKPRQ